MKYSVTTTKTTIRTVEAENAEAAQSQAATEIALVDSVNIRVEPYEPPRSYGLGSCENLAIDGQTATE